MSLNFRWNFTEFSLKLKFHSYFIGDNYSNLSFGEVYILSDIVVVAKIPHEALLASWNFNAIYYLHHIIKVEKLIKFNVKFEK